MSFFIYLGIVISFLFRYILHLLHFITFCHVVFIVFIFYITPSSSSLYKLCLCNVFLPLMVNHTPHFFIKLLQAILYYSSFSTYYYYYVLLYRPNLDFLPSFVPFCYWFKMFLLTISNPAVDYIVYTYCYLKSLILSTFIFCFIFPLFFYRFTIHSEKPYFIIIWRKSKGNSCIVISPFLYIPLQRSFAIRRASLKEGKYKMNIFPRMIREKNILFCYSMELLSYFYFLMHRNMEYYTKFEYYTKY